MSVSSRDPVLETVDLGYAYAPNRYAVRHLTLDLGRGEVLGLLGRNGAGKTTTVRLLTTLLAPTEGTATVLGQDIRHGGRALRSRLGVVLQAESLDFVSVERNLTLYAFLWGVARETARSRAEEMIELFELEGVRRRKPWALSGGERRRFQVARELMHDMELLFLDEPTVGLDAIARRRILRYLRERARGGLSIVFTTHILHEADLLCDRVAVLHQGKLIALDTARALKHRFGGAREVTMVVTAPIADGLRAEFDRDLAGRPVIVLAPDRRSPDADRTLALRAEHAETLLPWLSEWVRTHALELDRMTVEEATLEGAFLGLVGDADDAGKEDVAPEPQSAEMIRRGSGGLA